MPAADRIVRRIPSTRISETKFQISVVTLSIQFYMRRIVTGRSGSIWRIAARIKGMGRCSRGSKWMARTSRRHWPQAIDRAADYLRTCWYCLVGRSLDQGALVAMIAGEISSDSDHCRDCDARECCSCAFGIAEDDRLPKVEKPDARPPFG
jgi:hypothetical protein